MGKNKINSLNSKTFFSLYLSLIKFILNEFYQPQPRVRMPYETDNAIYHIHHKFAVIDSSSVIMGSFNWTGQAVKYNQEIIFFYEDNNNTNQYGAEFVVLIM